MRDLAEQSDGLLGALQESTSALREHTRSGTDLTLAQLEEKLDSLLQEYGVLLREIEPAKPGQDVDHAYEPFLRAMVAFATLIELLAPRLGGISGKAWGQHVFADSHFRYISFEKFPTGLPEEALPLIFPDQCSDLKSAVDEIARLGRVTLLKSFIFRDLDEIGITLACPQRQPHTLGIELMDAEWARQQLGCRDRDEIEEMAAERQIISVPTWTGELMYPKFQFQGSRLTDSVTMVCADAHPSFCGWPLAIWLATHQNEDLTYLSSKLGRIGLWMPNRTAPPTHEFRELERAAASKTPSFPLSGPAYRVCRIDNSPFYFSSADARDPHAGGRFDLDSASGMGSLYAGDSPLGAWAEVFGRLPVLTLHDLFGRRLWELYPRSSLDILDITDYTATIFSTVNRANTQEVAAMALKHGNKGLRVLLRASGKSMGVVLFGRAGAKLPSAAGIGLWDANPLRGIEDPGLWKYISNREHLFPEFPVVFRRFPTEVSMLPRI